MNKLNLLVGTVVMISIVFTASCVSKEVPITETYYETEYQTQYKTETHSVTEDIVVSTSEGKTYLSPVIKWHAGIYIKAAGSGAGGTYYYGYKVDSDEHTRSQIEIKTSSAAPAYIAVYDLTGIGQISMMPTTAAKTRDVNPKTGEIFLAPGEQEWFDNLNAVLTNPERILGRAEPGDEIRFDPENINEFAIIANTFNEYAIASVKLVWSDDIVEQRTVTKERQVPYQVPVRVEKQRMVTEIRKVPFWEAMQVKETPSTVTSEPPAAQEQTESSAVTTEAEPTEISPTLLYEDDYSDPSSGLFERSTSQGESYYKDGEFHGVVKMWDWSSWQYRRSAGRFKDFIMEEDIRLVSGLKDSNYGLIFRCQDDDNFYRFQVSANGSYVIGARLDGKWIDMLQWMPSEYIEKGYSTNHLKVICNGTQIEAYVNGHYLNTVVDDAFTDGYIGGFIYTPEPGAHVAFDNLKVYSLTSETP
jgi:hypothetical protein